MKEEKISPEMAEKLADVITWLEASGKDTEGFIRDQAPLLVKDMITWGYVECAVAGAIFLVIGSIASCVAVHWWRKGDDVPYKDEGFQAGCVIIGGAVTLFSSIGVIAAIYEASKIFFAPRLFIVQEIGRMLS
jgi:hypothetical protein